MRLSSRFGLAVGLVAALGAGAAAQETKLTGSIKVDGSSTTYLITEKMAANFKKLHPGLNITIGISGTGGGFKKFANGETDISNASRAMKTTEQEKCKERGVDFVELQVAWDGLAVIINKENTWATKMTVEQLKKIWEPGSRVRNWSDVDPKWPNEEIKLYGAGPDSGTFDYFTEAINGKEKAIRNDYNGSEDDNVTIQGVVRSKYAMGFLGLAYYDGHKNELNVVSVAEKEGAAHVPPTPENVLSKTYRPLSRPLFIYVRTDSLKRPEISQFTSFYMRRGDLVGEAKYVPMTPLQQLRERSKLDAVIRKLGS